MSRFLRADGEPAYSELKPERCPYHAVLDERTAKERRRVFMEEITVEEISGEDLFAMNRLFDQSRRRSR